ncbi:MAG: UTRA domain-containing protein [Pseudomonadota bacterium]
MSDAPSPPSLNRRIKGYLMSRIATGELKEGSRIPSETELCSMFNASRMTVSRAVRELAHTGFLVREQGSGTFVAKAPLSATMMEVRSIRSEIEARGGVHRSEVLRLEAITIEDPQAAAIGVPPGTPMALLEAIHMDAARPIQFERRHVNTAISPDFLKQDFTDRAASDFLLATVPFTDAQHTIAAVAAEGRAAALLKVDVGAPCLKLVRRTRLGDALITRAELIHPGADFELSGELPIPGIMMAVRQ